MDPRTKAQLDKLPPEKRAKAEALMARHRTPEARAREEAAREDYDRQIRETGTIATRPLTLLEVLGATLRERRRSAGLSLDDVAARSGIARSAVAALERGDNENPTVSTLERLAAAVGATITIGVEDGEAGAFGSEHPFR
jgi:ribosome-binding protein aMBF1 (putative translation factor)